jgi:hypothetical protein
MNSLPDKRLQPVQVICNPCVGQTYNYRHAVVSLTEDGLQVVCSGHVSRDERCVSFSCSGGVGSFFLCFAVKVNGNIKIFEGPGIGMGMLEKNQVLAACQH